MSECILTSPSAWVHSGAGAMDDDEDDDGDDDDDEAREARKAKRKVSDKLPLACHH